MKRRQMLVTAGLTVLVGVLPLRQAFAGSYLVRAALLVDQSLKEGDMLQPRSHDKHLAKMILQMAEARSDAASTMDVPKTVSRAHPHLLLVLAAAERAARAAVNGEFKSVLEHLNTSRNEARIFTSILRELGHTLPDVD